MTENLHDLATQIIGKVIDLPYKDGVAVIEQECADNKELYDMVMELYAAIAEEDEIQEAKKSTKKPTAENIAPKKVKQSTLIFSTFQKQIFSKKFNRYFILFIGFVILFATVFLLNKTVSSTLLTKEESKQQAQLDANIKVFEQWLHIEQTRIRALTRDDSLSYFAKELSLLKPSQIPIENKLRVDATNYLKHLKEFEGFSFVALIHGNNPSILALTLDVDSTGISTLTNKPIGTNTYNYYLQAKSAKQPVFIPPVNNNSDEQAGILSAFEEPYCALTVPIYNELQQVLGILAVGYSAKNDFSRLFQLNDYGKSANSYAFNSSGEMVSESRFVNQLQQTSLLDFDSTKSSIYNIAIKNPEVNVLKGRIPKKGTYEQEYTQVIKTAFKHIKTSKSVYKGSIKQAYSDYRGIKVKGTWVWFPQHNFGIISEQDKYEMYTSLRLLNYLSILFLIIVSMTALLLYRSNLQLYKANKKIADFEKLGEYKLLDKLGEGGFGVVYKAQHSFLKTPVAIKLLKEEFVGTDILDRFKKEVQVTSSLSHPNTIRLMDYGTNNQNQFYYVMEYLNGISLERVMEMDKHISINRLVHILLHTCLSLREAHDKGIIHRDVKPANIMVCNLGGETDFVKLLDFGLVKELNAENADHTKINRIGGTPMFMAPERLRSPMDADRRVDIYAVGAIGLFMLSGQYLLELVSQKMLAGHETLTGDFKSMLIEREDVPDELKDLLLGCIHFNPDKRPTNIAEVIKILEALQKEHPWNRNDAKPWWEEHKLLS